MPSIMKAYYFKATLGGKCSPCSGYGVRAEELALYIAENQVIIGEGIARHISL